MCTAPLIDGLVVIANDHVRAAVTSNKVHHLTLGEVHVLEFVHADVIPFGLDVLLKRWKSAHEHPCGDDHVVEVEFAFLAAQLIMALVHACVRVWAAFWRVHQRCRLRGEVLRNVWEAEITFLNAYIRVKVLEGHLPQTGRELSLLLRELGKQLLAGFREQALAEVILSNGKVSQPHGARSIKDTSGQRMQGQGFDASALWIFGNFLTHAAPGFARKGGCEDAGWTHALVADKMANALD